MPIVHGVAWPAPHWYFAGAAAVNDGPGGFNTPLFTGTQSPDIDILGSSNFGAVGLPGVIFDLVLISDWYRYSRWKGHHYEYAVLCTGGYFPDQRQ